MLDPDQIQDREQLELTIEAAGPQELLVDWLNELVFLFETQGFLTAACEVEITADRCLEARLHGETYNPSRHAIEAVIKAATHHGLSVQPIQDGWQAEVVIDL